MKTLLPKIFYPRKSSLFFFALTLCIVESFSLTSFAKERLNSTTIFVDKSIQGFPVIQETPSVFQLISHGRSGELLINGEWKNARQIAEWLSANGIQQSANKPTADSRQPIAHLNIYGCEFAKGAKGLEAVAYLEKTLGVSVAASSNLTGEEGDWNLEVGQPVSSIVVSNFKGNLQTCACDTTKDCIGTSTHCTGWYSTNGNFDVGGANSSYDSFAGLSSPKWGFDIQGQSTAYGTPQAAALGASGVGPLVRHDYPTVSGNNYSESFWFTKPPNVVGPYANNGPVVLQVVDKATGTVLQTIDLMPGGTFTGGLYTLNFTAIGTTSEIQVGYTNPDPTINTSYRNFLCYPYPLYNLTTGTKTSEFSFVSATPPTNVIKSTSGSSAILSATCATDPNAFLTWYANSTLIGYGNNLTITPTAGTTYTATCSIGCGCTSTAATAITCNAGSTAMTLSATTKSNVCPASTTDITTLVTSTCPTGSSLEWHTASTPTAANKYSTPSTAAAGTYYPVCFDATNNCYSPAPATGVTVTITTCCNAGTTAMTLSGTTATNSCPTATANISGLVSSTCPTNSTLEWHTSSTPTSANKYTTPTTATAGVYYPFCYDATNNCYNPAPATGVTVTITGCPVSLTNTCPTSTVNLNTALTLTATTPPGTTLTWHTATPVTAANTVADPTKVGAGTYYASFYDATNNCYGPVSAAVTVTTTICCTAGSTAPLMLKN